MRWKIGHFDYNPSTNVLSGPSGETLLEPKSAALLTYFLEHQGHDISRDELMEDVWLGQVVSENAINRVVVRLRKALGDDDKVKRYIVTVPKVGYRFVATATKQLEVSPPPKPLSQPYQKPVLAAVLMLPILAGWWMLRDDETSPPRGGANVSPLVRLADEQFDGAMSHNGKHFVYSHAQDGDWRLYWVKETGGTPQLIGPEDGLSTSASWAPDDSMLAYQYRSGANCEFHLIKFEDDTPTTPQKVYDCPAGTDTPLVFSSDASKLFFVEQESEFAPQIAYEYDLHSSSKRRLSQPTATGKGNYHIDKHPTSDTLLLLSADRPGSTSAFALEVSKNSFTKLKTFDYSVDYAVWGHTGETLVHMGEHPSYELVETNLTTDFSTVLVSDSRRISEPRRIANGRDYLFRSFLYNRDIAKNDVVTPSLNSSVRDYLPAYSNDGSKLAFISKRAGYSQIWIENSADNSLVAIDVIDRGRKYYDLKWSYDDAFVAATTDAGLLIIDVINGAISQTINLNLPTHGLGWNSERAVNYSHYDDGRWNLFSYDLTTDTLTAQDSDHAFLLTSQDRTLYIDQRLILRNLDGQPIQTEGCASAIHRYHLNYQLVGSTLYCLASDRQSLLAFAESGVAVRHALPASASRYYTINKQNITVSVLTTANSDIMRTNFTQ